MAETRTQFALAIADWSKPAIEHLLTLADAVDALGNDETAPEDTPENLVERAREIVEQYNRGTDACFELDDADGSLSIYAEEHGCVGATADIIQHAMAAHGIKQPVILEYANTCSRMRSGEFGGGAVVITIERLEWMDTGRWAKDMASRLAAAVPATGISGGSLRFENVPCSNTAEYGPDPEGATFTIDRTTAARIIAISSALATHDLWSANAFTGLCHWMAAEDSVFADEDGELRTEGDTLCVGKTHFWFEASPKHDNGTLSTAEMSIADLAKHFGLAFPAEPGAA